MSEAEQDPIIRTQRFSAKPQEVSPTGKLEIRRARHSDAAEIMKACNTTFEMDRPPEYWLKKFTTADECFSFIAVDEAGTVHAQFAGSPAPVSTGSGPGRVLIAGDIFARRSRSAIGARLFLQVTTLYNNFFSKDGRFLGVLGFPNPVAVGIFNRIYTDTAQYKIPTYSMPLHQDIKDRSRSSFLKRLLYPALSNKRIAFSRTRIKTFGTLSEEFLLGAEAVRVRRRLGASWPPQIERSRDWLIWRYELTGAYYGKYSFHITVVNERPFAWLITRKLDRQLVFVDWQIGDGNADCPALLSNAAQTILRESECSEARALMTRPALSSWDANFQEIVPPESEGLPFFVLRYHKADLDYGALFLTYGDTDRC